ncbi:hypothetical protein Celaphus_00011551 [Cervus elaphus hippelaphus]|uniref:Uncharacterized protein n=1 Tax=Cervus elaphus hippelaphus TaxID=46360 RepID=A0A212DFH0_CEREH|nr:hypothetical protein Celaphus_00011551 [Cervus elaphus hippelaphus]
MTAALALWDKLMTSNQANWLLNALSCSQDVELSPSSAPEHLVSVQTNGTACLPRSRTRGRKELQAAEKTDSAPPDQVSGGKKREDCEEGSKLRGACPRANESTPLLVAPTQHSPVPWPLASIHPRRPAPPTWLHHSNRDET